MESFRLPNLKVSGFFFFYHFIFIYLFSFILIKCLKQGLWLTQAEKIFHILLCDITIEAVSSVKCHYSKL